MAYRVVRSSERRVFKIDVGGVPPQDVEPYMQKIVTQLKRNSVVDATTGRVDLRYNPMSIEEDYFIPVRAGSATDIQTLAGAQNITAIDDVKYLRDKLFSALKVPQSYLTMGEGATEDKTTLAQKDIRFSRTIQRLQRVVIAELEKIGIIHLYTLGFRGDDLLAFKLSLNNPSKIAELQEIEHWKSKFDIAASATEGFFSRRWVADNIFGLSHEEFTRNQREMYYDRKHDAALQQVAEGAAAEGAAGGLGGDMGGGLDADLGGGLDADLGGGEEIAAADVGGLDADDASGAGGGDESSLLAVPPGSRPARRLTPGEKKKSRTTPGAKGKVYNPTTTDSRPQGARTRHLKSIGSMEITPRTTLPGRDALSALGRGVTETSQRTGFYEEDESTYSVKDRNQEKQILEVNQSVRQLVEILEKKDKSLTEQKNED